MEHLLFSRLKDWIRQYLPSSTFVSVEIWNIPRYGESKGEGDFKDICGDLEHYFEEKAVPVPVVFIYIYIDTLLF